MYFQLSNTESQQFQSALTRKEKKRTQLNNFRNKSRLEKFGVKEFHV